MRDIQLRETEKFPEPEFLRLQQLVFSDIQATSPQLDEVLAIEREFHGGNATQKISALTPLQRIGAYCADELVGWSYGWLERGATFYMANSGVHPAFRRQGIYSTLLDTVATKAKHQGAVKIRSQHSVLNNAIIVCKLQRGFQITGLSQSAQMGALVELTLHLSPARASLFRSRFIPLVATGIVEEPSTDFSHTINDQAPLPCTTSSS